MVHVQRLLSSPHIQSNEHLFHRVAFEPDLKAIDSLRVLHPSLIARLHVEEKDGNDLCVFRRLLENSSYRLRLKEKETGLA
jgi:hypothetical protein